MQSWCNESQSGKAADAGFGLASAISCQNGHQNCTVPLLALCLKKNGLCWWSTFQHSAKNDSTFEKSKCLYIFKELHLSCNECDVLSEASTKRKEWEVSCKRETALLTDCGDDSPSKEKGGTDVPQAHLIGCISWRVHTCSDCWNHLLEGKVKEKKKKLAHSALFPSGSVVWGGLRNIRT